MEIVKKADVKVSMKQVGVIFAESMMTIVDTIIDQTRPNQMKFVEFAVFLCRICYEHYRDTPYENEMMYLKIEKLLPKFLAIEYLEPLFLFNEDFEYKPRVKQGKRQKRVVVVQKKESSDDLDSSDQKEDSEDDESSSEDDLGECVILEEGKFKLSIPFFQRMQKEKAEKAERRKAREERLAAKEKEREEKRQERLKKQKALEEEALKELLAQEELKLE